MKEKNTSSRFVYVIEDHEEFRESLKFVLDNTPGYVCLGTFSSCEEFFDFLQMEYPPPDIILLDIGLPGMTGIEGIHRIRAVLPSTQIIMLTVFEDNDKVFRSICSGAVGYILKSSGPTAIFEAIDLACEGGAPMSPAIARNVLKMFQEFGAPAVETEIELTPREYEVLNGLVDGLGYKQIAACLHISTDTVRNHIRHIYEKLQVHSKSEAVAKALRARLL